MVAFRFWFLILHLFLNKNAISQSLEPIECAVVIDAGSTGTRVFTYGWNDTDAKQIQLLGSKSNETPITEIDVESDAYDLFNDLIQFATETAAIHDCHCHRHNDNCPIYIKATGGMRLLSAPKQRHILSTISEVMRNESFNPFSFAKGYASIISGQEEGLFEWLSINYIRNTNKNDFYTKNSQMALVTSGGASVQLTFLCIDIENIEKKTHRHLIEFDDMKIYSQSYLGLGHREMRQKVDKLFYDESILNNQTKMLNPCLFEGYVTTYYIPENMKTSVQQFGTGQPHKCKNTIKEIFHLNGINVHQPKFAPHLNFYATQFLSASIQDLNVPKNIALYNLSYIVYDLCTKHIHSYSSHQCFDAIYSLYLLSDIFKFPEINSPVIFTNDYSWTVGFLLYQFNLNRTNVSANTNNSITSLAPTRNPEYNAEENTVCGGVLSKAYKQSAISFYLHTHYQCSITFDASASDFSIGSITAIAKGDYYHNSTVIANTTANKLTLVNQPRGTYFFILEAANPDTIGTYHCSVSCGYEIFNRHIRQRPDYETERYFISQHGVVNDSIFVNQYIQQRIVSNDILLQNTIKEYTSLQMTDRMKNIYQLSTSYENLTNYDILSTLHLNDIPPFIQGGMVRDLLLGIDANDMDVVVYCNMSALNQTVNKLGWSHYCGGGDPPFILFLDTMGIDISIADGQLGTEYDVNDARWNYVNNSLLISNSTLYAINNRLISAKSYEPLFHEWCFLKRHVRDFAGEICLWKILRAWKLRIAPKFFKWDYSLWSWIKSTIITEFVYQTNATLAASYKKVLLTFFNSEHWSFRSPLILYQMKLDLGEKLFKLFIPETVLESQQRTVDKLEKYDPYKWAMKCNEDLLICDIEKVDTETTGNILFDGDVDPSKINGLELNNFILICVAAFMIGSVFVIILMHSHKCCSCCGRRQQYDVNETVGGMDEGFDVKKPTSSDGELEPELQVTNKYIYILFFNTLATYSLHRFIGRYSIFFAQEFNITFLQVGYLQSALYFGHIMSVFCPTILQSNFILKYISNLSYKTLFFSFKIGLGLSTLAYIIYHPFWFLFLTRFLFGLMYCLYGVYRATFIATNEKQINKQLWIFSFFSLNKPIGLLLLSTFGIFIVYLSPQMALFVLVLPCLLLSLLFLIYFPNNAIYITSNKNTKSTSRDRSISTYISNGHSPHNQNEDMLSFGNLGQIGLILSSCFGGVKNEMFNICLSAWYHDTFNLNASQFWIVIILSASSRITTFVLLTITSKICKYYNNDSIYGALYFMAAARAIQFGNFLFLFMTYNHIHFVSSLICVGIFNMGSCAVGVASTILSVNLVSNKKDKSKLNAGMKASHAFGMLIGSFLGPLLFTMNSFETVMFVVCIASFATVVSCGIIIISYIKKA